MNCLSRDPFVFPLNATVAWDIMQAALDGAIHHGRVHYIQPILIQVLKMQLRWEIQFAVRPGIMDRLTQGRKMEG